jgi:hypothetical protein
VRRGEKVPGSKSKQGSNVCAWRSQQWVVAARRASERKRWKIGR